MNTGKIDDSWSEIDLTEFKKDNPKYKKMNKITEPKVELKNVKMFRGHDVVGMECNIWINGVKCMHMFDDARGGEYEYQSYTYNNPQAEVVKKNIKLLEDYIKTLPKDKSSIDGFEFDVDMDMYIASVHERQEKQKEENKRQRLMETAFIFTKEGMNGYKYIDYRKPLKSIQKQALQAELDKWVFKYKQLDPDLTCINTNLAELGLTIKK